MGCTDLHNLWDIQTLDEPEGNNLRRGALALEPDQCSILHAKGLGINRAVGAHVLESVGSKRLLVGGDRELQHAVGVLRDRD